MYSKLHGQSCRARLSSKQEKGNIFSAGVGGKKSGMHLSDGLIHIRTTPTSAI